jgi:hypothetical protein
VQDGAHPCQRRRAGAWGQPHAYASRELDGAYGRNGVDHGSDVKEVSRVRLGQREGEAKRKEQRGCPAQPSPPDDHQPGDEQRRQRPGEREQPLRREHAHLAPGPRAEPHRLRQRDGVAHHAYRIIVPGHGLEYDALGEELEATVRRNKGRRR